MQVSNLRKTVWMTLRFGCSLTLSSPALKQCPVHEVSVVSEGISDPTPSEFGKLKEVEERNFRAGHFWCFFILISYIYAK